MLNKILIYGTVAGLLVGSMLFGTVLIWKDGPPAYGMLLGYTTMLIALSAVFVAIKRHRDDALGGVIRFWPALGLGVGISVVAGIFYVLAWEAALAVTQADYISAYINETLAQKRAAGASAAELARHAAEMEAFRIQYADPLYRMPLTFAEIFPVGLLVSLVSAGLLRNPRFLPARTVATA